MKVSMIIPVYNTPEDAFARCIRSILAQTCGDFEVIVIDDGSRDELSAEYETVCRGDPRIRYRKTENRGVSEARNTGIRMAEGEFTAFADGDDTVAPCFLERALALAEENGADAVIGLLECCPPRPLEQNIPELMTGCGPAEVLSFLYNVDGNPRCRVLGSPCGRIYRTALVRDTLFDGQLRYFEDQVFTRQVISGCARIVLAPERWYTYYQNDYSALHRHRRWDELDGWILYWNRWAEMNDREADGPQKQQYDKMLMSYFYMAVYEGLMAGETYSRKKLLRLLELPPFARVRRCLKTGDFRSLKLKAEYLLIRCRLTLPIYLLSKGFRVINRRAEQTT